MKKGLSPKERDEKAAKIFLDLNRDLTKKTLEQSLKRDNGLAQMVVSGAKGSPGQLSQTLTAPVMFSDHNQKPILMPIKNSFAQGLDPAEYWASSYGTRRGVISTKFATADAGAFAKQLSQAALGLVVTERDCGTDNGLPTDPSDRDNLDAYLAKPAGGYPRNTRITPKLLAEFKKKRIKNFVVRSPITCEAKKGVCAYCRGVTELNKLPDIGTNVGLAASSAMAEPVTQMSLNVKHSGGVAGVGGIASGYQLLNQLTSVPKEFPNRAALAGETGRVKEVKKAPQGGHFIYVGDTRHYSLPGIEPKVKPGQRVEEGDPLDEGLVNPSEVVHWKGIGEGRRHLTESLRSAFEDAGAKVHRRHLETISRALVNQAQVDDGDAVDGVLPDDLVDFQYLQSNYRPSEKRTVSPKEAEGKFLTKPVLHYTTGTKVLPSFRKKMEEYGIGKVEVEESTPPFRPLMVRMQEVPHIGTDWMTQMYSRNLKRQLAKAVHRGAQAPVHGISFIPSLAHSKTFGKSPRGPAEY